MFLRYPYFSKNVHIGQIWVLGLVVLGFVILGSWVSGLGVLGFGFLGFGFWVLGLSFVFCVLCFWGFGFLSFQA